MITTIIIFIIILGVLVFVHEFGHFYAARKSGMKVDEFGFGFPPRMVGIQKLQGGWSFVWGHGAPKDPTQTVYSINWIPLGGFVKILGEDNAAADDPRSFINRPFAGRFLTLIAGVTMNIVLAWLLISVLFATGLPTEVSSGESLPKYAKLSGAHVAVVELVQNGPAHKAGIIPGDEILALDGLPMPSLNSVPEYIASHKGQTITFTVKRGSETKNIAVASKANPGENEGPTGVVLANVGMLSYPWYMAPVEGAKAVFTQMVNIVKGVYQLLVGDISLSSVGGPVKIAQLTGQVADLGLIYIVQFTAFLSLNLAILNILPFPALDGGRVLFLLIEKVRGRRNNQRVEQFVNTAGFVFLLLVMVVVTIKDIFGK